MVIARNQIFISMEILKSTFEEILQLLEDEQVRTEFPLIGKRCGTYKSVDEGSYYIAIENETLVGAALCSIRTDGMFRINLFEVRESWHNMGIGRKMFEFISEDIGNRPITLSYAGNKNGEAYNFWVKMGFVQRYRDGRSHEMINKKYAFLANRNRQGIPIVAKRVITEKNGVIDVKEIDYRNESY